MDKDSKTKTLDTDLGLPLEYQKLPEYFDAGNISDNTAEKNAVIEKLLKTYQVNTVLDLTCGTGSQVFFLNERGYKVTGADFSPELLKTARERASRKKIDLTFIDGDMRTLKVGTFDAVVTIFNAIGHVTKADFEKTLRNICSNLKDGGIYIFDIINLDAMTDTVVADFAYQIHKKVGDTQYLATQCSTIDRARGILTSYDAILIQKNAEAPERFHNTFSLQIYNATELRTMLAKNGFETLGHYGMKGEKFMEDSTQNILTVAQKIEPRDNKNAD
ncbi:MAG: methyltransferase domain-containing protein [Gammaproteobacteria bacterium]|nr:methyltransferase domain-containing protein [Gammaproteobacteria bacterium]